jgi:hypothetical protein
VTANTTEYAANGGRIGYNKGTDFQKWLEGKQKFEQGQNFEQLYREYLEDKRRQKVAEQKTMAANGGRIGYQIGGLSSLYVLILEVKNLSILEFQILKLHYLVQNKELEILLFPVLVLVQVE